MKEKLIKLIDIKSIVTLTLLFASVSFVYMGLIKPDPIVTLLQVAVSFYFGMKLGEKVSK